MKKNNNELYERDKLLNKRVDELREDFKNLNDNQKKLLAYRKIMELSNKSVSLRDSLDISNKDREYNLDSKSFDDEIFAIIEASEFNTKFM